MVPQPAGWGALIPAYSQTPAHSASNSPTGRLGIFHSSLKEEHPRTQPAIPQPAGWGSFIPAYSQTPAHSASNSPTGRLGIIHTSIKKNTTDPASPKPADW